MASDKQLVLGVDIGGSKMNFVVWDGKKVIERWLTKEVSLEKLKEEVFRSGLKKVGIGVPGILDFKTGKTLRIQNLENFDGLDLKKLLKKDVRLDNDANCFLRAEVVLGAAKGYPDALGITMGTGIGGAIMISSKCNPEGVAPRPYGAGVQSSRLIYRGYQGSAGEFGQMVINDGKTWEELYRELRDNHKQAEKIHAQALANLINIFNPGIIVLGGRGAKIPDMKSAEKYILSPLARETKIVLGKLGLDAGAIGAALLFDYNEKT